MTNPKLTDEAVGRLPLSRARAELLEDIMATAPIESVTDAPVRRPRRRGMLIAVGTAAATVAALFAVPALLNSADNGPGSGAVADQSASAPGEHLVLDAPGWRVAYTYEGDGRFEVQYVNGDHPSTSTAARHRPTTSTTRTGPTSRRVENDAAPARPRSATPRPGPIYANPTEAAVRRTTPGQRPRRRPSPASRSRCSGSPARCGPTARTTTRRSASCRTGGIPRPAGRDVRGRLPRAAHARARGQRRRVRRPRPAGLLRQRRSAGRRVRR